MYIQCSVFGQNNPTNNYKYSARHNRLFPIWSIVKFYILPFHFISPLINLGFEQSKPRWSAIFVIAPLSLFYPSKLTTRFYHPFMSTKYTVQQVSHTSSHQSAYSIFPFNLRSVCHFEPPNNWEFIIFLLFSSTLLNQYSPSTFLRKSCLFFNTSTSTYSNSQSMFLVIFHQVNP